MATTAQATVQVSASCCGAAELDGLAPSLEAGWMGMGPQTAAFEAAMEHRLGSSFVMTSSGTSALTLALHVLDLPPGSDVVVPSFAWVACAQAVLLNGHRPVFCDVDPQTHNAGLDAVERAMTPRTAALLVLHYAGLPAEVEALAQLGVPIVEDAAHAVDSSVGERPCGTLGDIAAFSFDSVKNVATPDAGGLTGRDPQMVGRARALRLCGLTSTPYEQRASGGRWWEQTITGVFGRATPNDVAASIGLVQLDRLAEHQARRREVWRAYAEQLADVPWLRLPLDAPEGRRHSYFTYLVRVGGERRDAVARRLLERGVYTTLRYPPLHHQALFGPPPVLPHTDRLAEEGLNLPLHPGLSDLDVELIVDTVRGT